MRFYKKRHLGEIINAEGWSECMPAFYNEIRAKKDAIEARLTRNIHFDRCI